MVTRGNVWEAEVEDARGHCVPIVLHAGVANKLWTRPKDFQATHFAKRVATPVSREVHRYRYSNRGREPIGSK